MANASGLDIPYIRTISSTIDETYSRMSSTTGKANSNLSVTLTNQP